MAIDYQERIPNNVDLAWDRRVLKALERWHPGYLDWWTTMGPEGFQDMPVYLRTAVSVDPKGWAKHRFKMHEGVAHTWPPGEPGNGFKVAMVPFHMWTPDVYDGSPAPVAGFMAAGVKAAKIGH